MTTAPTTTENDTTGCDPVEKALARAVTAQFRVLNARPLESGLYLVATPIGNLSDITLRALHVLARASIVYCEDTRQSRKLMERYALRPRLRAYHQHNAERERPRLLEALANGDTVALISDAGTPLISDPGHKLVREARAAGITVRAIPGPSAVVTGLTVSGLEVDRFFFEGFLPAKGPARRDRLEKLIAIPGALVFYEAPGRLAATLADLATVLGNRHAAVTRELTKLHEEHLTGSLPDLAAHYEDASVRGEIVLLVAPPQRGTDISDDVIREALSRLLETMSLRDASHDLAKHFGVARKHVYELGLATQGEDHSNPGAGANRGRQ